MSIILPPSHFNYRLGDLVLQKEKRTSPCDDGWGTMQGDATQTLTLAECTVQKWPSSVASTYLQQTDNVGDVKVLSNIVRNVQSQRKFDIPAKDDIVIHVRVGDVIDIRSKCPRDYTNGVPSAIDFWTKRTNSFPWLNDPSWGYYVRCKDDVEDLLKLLRRRSPHSKLKLVYGVHTSGSFLESTRYLHMLRDFCTSWGYDTEFVTHSDADESFIYMCHAHTFCAAGGGFSDLVSKIVRRMGHFTIPYSRHCDNSLLIAAVSGAIVVTVGSLAVCALLLLVYRQGSARAQTDS